MYVKRIEVQNFRNIKAAELDFSPGINIFCGNNAQGKTNLLEAIAITLGKSFRKIKRNDIVPFNSDNKTKINLYYESQANPDKINEICYEQAHVTINSIPLKKAADLYGEFKYVVFTPDNLSLIKGEPALRRYYLDNIAIMQNKSHRRYMQEYKNALNQRCTAYLSNSYSYSYSREMLDVWDDILVKQGINLTYGRLKYLSLIEKYACKIYQDLSNGEKLEMSYKSNVFSQIDFENTNILYDIYKQKLQSVNSEGQSYKTPGAHRDDISFTIDGNCARTYASQGQLRSIVISLKLAESEIIRSFNRQNPVVLFDEVLGELDEVRRQFIIKHFVDSQVFITSCNVNDFKDLGNSKVWSVENGVFSSR